VASAFPCVVTENKLYIYIYIYICMYVLILLIKLLDTFDRQHVLFLFIVFLLSFACVVICG
jgi:hypothetical protein